MLLNLNSILSLTLVHLQPGDRGVAVALPAVHARPRHAPPAPVSGPSRPPPVKRLFDTPILVVGMAGLSFSRARMLDFRTLSLDGESFSTLTQCGHSFQCLEQGRWLRVQLVECHFLINSILAVATGFWAMGCAWVN